MRYLLVLIFFFGLISCGFKPRGEIPLAPPLHNLYLRTAEPYGRLAHILRQYLKESGVCFADCPENANLVLQIITEQTHEQMLSVGGTELTRQYSLILTVSFQITTPQGKPVVSPQVLTQSRIIPIRSNQVLAGSNEALNLYQQMRLAIAYDLMNRLSSEDMTDILMHKKKKYLPKEATNEN